MTGHELRKARLLARLTLADIAAALDISRQRVWGIERADYIRPATAERYRAALAQVLAAYEREREAFGLDLIRQGMSVARH